MQTYVLMWMVVLSFPAFHWEKFWHKVALYLTFFLMLFMISGCHDGDAIDDDEQEVIEKNNTRYVRVEVLPEHTLKEVQEDGRSIVLDDSEIEKLENNGSIFVRIIHRGRMGVYNWFLAGDSAGAEASEGLATNGSGLYVAAKTTKIAAYSTDGNIWTASSTYPFYNQGVHGMAYGEGLFVAVAEDTSIMTTPDGVTWTSRINGYGSYLSSIAYGDGTFVVGGGYGGILYSDDGINWTGISGGFGTTNLNGVAFGNGRFVAIGDEKIRYSDDNGRTWTGASSIGTLMYFTNITYGNGLFVITAPEGSNTYCKYSSDGDTWSQATIHSGTTGRQNIAYGDGLFVVGGYENFYISTNAQSWSALSALKYGNYSIVWGDRFIMATSSGFLYTY